MKLLHTSDIQLDAPFTVLGEGGQRHRQQLLETFEAIATLAEEEGDLLVIAGDLFDSNRPLQSTIERVIRTLGKLSIPVCILPGNHDPYDDTSVYRRVVFPSNVTIFSDKLTVMNYPALDLTVYGNAITEKDSRESPLKDIRPGEGQSWQIALAHGNLATGAAKNPFRPITMDEIAQSGMDYIALGDWHGFADYSQGTVKAFYSGSPEPMAFDQEQAGYIARVSLEEGNVRVEKVRVGGTQARQIELDVSNLDQGEVENILSEKAAPDLMLDVVLKGLHQVGSVIDPAGLEARLVEQFYALRIQDQSHVQLGELSLEEFPEEHIIGKFLGIMRERIESAEDETDVSRLERAIQLGVALLQGKDVL